MKIAERIFILIMALFAVIILKECGRLPTGSEFTIGPWFLPRYISLFIIAVSAILMIQSFLKRGENSKQKDFITKNGLIRLTSFSLVLLLAILSVSFAGMFIPLGVFMAVIYKFGEKYDWLPSVKVSVLSIVIFYLIFKVWLGVPIPGISF